MSENGEHPEAPRFKLARKSGNNMTTATYLALVSRDPRFDGVFFVGVTSTGIYCRPVCPAKTPKKENCRFFASAEAAEKAGFRPCLRCRPESAPGHAPVDHAQRITHLLVQRMTEGMIDDTAGLEEISGQFGMSSRQLRRIVHRELGVSPIELMQTRRLLLAKQLLTETALPVTEIAFASGFSSLRRFNDAFKSQYRMPPTRLRRESALRPGKGRDNDTSILQLCYRPPYDWPGILKFLEARRIQEVESITGGCYRRTVRLGQHSGWIEIKNAAEKQALMVEFSHSLMPVLPALLERLRHLFDLTARPDLINAHLLKDPILRKAVRKNPGLRIPGAFDGFEMATRAILGQQITVKAATTLACRFALAFGDKIKTPFPELTRLTPLPKRIARAGLEDIAKLGILRSRAASILGLTRAVSQGTVQLAPGVDPEASIHRLISLPGIGPWTAHYIAMRALRWPDAFPKEDIVLRRNLGGISSRQAEEMSQAWRPWRSYAVVHLWRNPLSG